MKWAYGITTVPERRFSYLPKTVASLEKAGFTSPTIFVDGREGDYTEFDTVVKRSSQIRAYGHWLLTLTELWIRNPNAERFAIFQDDLVTYQNLRQYLEGCELRDNMYWNLYTFPQNEKLDWGTQGWYVSNQRGRGAVALVFTNEVVFRLLTHPMMIVKPKTKHNPHRSIDGVVLTSLKKSDPPVREYVHYPTLVQHIGDCSSIGNRQHEKPSSFLGVDYDATNLLSDSIKL